MWPAEELTRAAWPAEELTQRLAAREWAAAHALFAAHLAPRWWHGRQVRRLRGHLAQLAQAAPQVEAAVGPAAWNAGGRLYLAYFRLEVGLVLAGERSVLREDFVSTRGVTLLELFHRLR